LKTDLKRSVLTKLKRITGSNKNDEMN